MVYHNLILADIAMDPASFDEFEAAVSGFFASRDGEEEQTLNEAVECVRTNLDDTRFPEPAAFERRRSARGEGHALQLRRFSERQRDGLPARAYY